MSDKEMFFRLLKDNQKVIKAIKEKYKKLMKMINNIKPFDGVVKAIKYLYSKNYPLAIASSSPSFFVVSLLKKYR